MSEPLHNAATAGFSTSAMLVKLVLLPALLVAAFMAVALLVGWARFAPGDADAALEALQRGGGAPWRAAVLVQALADPRNGAMRQDPRLLDRLVEILHRERARGYSTPEGIELCGYLCLAIGQFELAGGIPILADTARGRGEPLEAPLRVAALEALALLAGRLGPHVLHHVPGSPSATALAAILECAEDADARVRGAAAYTLGVAGGAEAAERLHTLLLDAVPAVRYNAATGLARLGDPACAGILAEMLEVSMPGGRRSEAWQFGENPLARNALRAAETLEEALRVAPARASNGAGEQANAAESDMPLATARGLAALHHAVEQAARRDPSPEVRTRAAAIERRLRQAGIGDREGTTQE